MVHITFIIQDEFVYQQKRNLVNVKNSAFVSKLGKDQQTLFQRTKEKKWFSFIFVTEFNISNPRI